MNHHHRILFVKLRLDLLELPAIAGICLECLGMKEVGAPILRANSPLQVENWRAKTKTKKAKKNKSQKQKTILVGKPSLVARLDHSGIAGMCLGLWGMKGVGVPILRANSRLQVENWRAKKTKNAKQNKSQKQETKMVEWDCWG